MIEQIKTVNAGRGWQWIVEGFALFRRSPLNWIAQCLALLAIFGISTQLGLLGVLALNLLYPVFLAGLMLGCRSLESSGRMHLTHVFSAFGPAAPSLITLGGVALAAQIALSFVVILVGGEDFEQLVVASQQGLEKAVEAVSAMDASALARAQLATSLSLALNLPLVMAMWFAPLLVVFHRRPVARSLLESVVACLKNVLPFLVYGLAVIALAVIAVIPFGLGLFLLVPTVFASIYAAYRDLFPEPEPEAAALPESSTSPD